MKIPKILYNKASVAAALAVITALSLCVPAFGEPDGSPLKNSLVISEIMVKNHATLSDEDGEQPDWIELHNTSSRAIDLSGFIVSDNADGGWSIPSGTVEADGYFLVYCDGKDRAGDIPHADFALSQDETVYLRDAGGELIDSAECTCGTADLSLMLDENGKWTTTAYPTPGYPNTSEGYDAWQNTLSCASPLIISEAMTYNTTCYMQKSIEYCDWIELRNVSDTTLELSDYYLSDKDEDLKKFQLPSMSLKPGKSVIVLCTDETGAVNSGYIIAPFSLASDRERVYLSKNDELVDYVFLHDIPFGCSYGRITGENGWFFFDEPRPNAEQTSGYRRVSKTPTSPCEDGVFNGVTAMSVELSGSGNIYYTTDGSLPTVNSKLYTQPFDVTKTCVVRAVTIEDGAMPSRALTLSYIINENHSLPVVSLATDSPYDFNVMYSKKKKDTELPGSLSFYEDTGSFTIPCGIDMHGGTSLDLSKKSMGVRFRGVYGQDMLDYDLYGGGVTEFESFILRAGQDYYNTIIKNELGENLCLQFSDTVFAQRSRYCVLYINGEYWGIYALMEKMNESHYATHRNVSKDSVTVVKAPVDSDSDFYRDIIEFSKNNDLTTADNYEEFCRRMDIDSLIDWIIIEGYTANTDLNLGNVRYAKSTEDDGKWRLMLYDMDSIITSNTNCFTTVLGKAFPQYSTFISQLIKNPDFKEKFLARTAEVFKGALSDENVLAEIDRLAAEIDPEVARDYGRFGLSKTKWENSVATLRDLITDWHWQQSCIDAICKIFGPDSADYFS